MRIGVGEDAHEFEKVDSKKPLIIGGVAFKGQRGLDADSDGDVVYHALCQALACIHHAPILAKKAIELCQSGQKNSKAYVLESLKHLGKQKIEHVSFSIEAQKPRLQEKIPAIRKNVAALLGINYESVGVVCTTGNNLSLSAKAMGVRAICTLISTHQD